MSRRLQRMLAAACAAACTAAPWAGATGALAPGPAPEPAAPVSAAAGVVSTTDTVSSPPAPSFAPVVAGRAIAFPTDFGSHPDFRTEWWYVTGWLTTRKGEPLGFQITFFRTRPAIDASNPSTFTPHQLLIAHCALSDPERGHLWQDQKIRRAGQGLAEAAEGDTNVWIDGWSLKRAAGVYTANVDAEDFALHLTLRDTEPPLLNGAAGVSRKGPAPEAASYYYSLPHVRVAGTVARKGEADAVSGEAWFDHEWSSEYLDREAVGWDWIGINLDDGSALMAFRIRGLKGDPRWAGGTFRRADGHTEILEPADVVFSATRRWQSPRSGVVYPVQWSVRAGPLDLELKPLMDDQENDTRLSTGAIYWEGAVRAYRAGRPAGLGYLELTGYGQRLRLR